MEFCNLTLLFMKLIRNGEVDAAFSKLHEWYPQIVEVWTVLHVIYFSNGGKRDWELAFIWVMNLLIFQETNYFLMTDWLPFNTLSQFGTAFITFCFRFFLDFSTLWYLLDDACPLPLQDDKSAVCFLLHCQKFIELVRVIFNFMLLKFIYKEKSHQELIFLTAFRFEHCFFHPFLL